MAVRAYFRGQGVSSLLVLVVAQFALSVDCDWVVLTTGRAMGTAPKAYLRLGFWGRETPENVVLSGNAWVLEEKHGAGGRGMKR